MTECPSPSEEHYNTTTDQLPSWANLYENMIADFNPKTEYAKMRKCLTMLVELQETTQSSVPSTESWAAV